MDNIWIDFTEAVIVKEGSQYCIKSKSGKNLGCYATREAALKRLRQIEFFKHVAEALEDESEDEDSEDMCTECGKDKEGCKCEGGFKKKC